MSQKILIERSEYNIHFKDEQLMSKMKITKEEYDKLMDVGAGVDNGIPYKLCQCRCDPSYIRSLPNWSKMQEDSIEKFKAILTVFDIKAPKELVGRLKLMMNSIQRSINLLDGTIDIVAGWEDMEELKSIKFMIDVMTKGITENAMERHKKVSQ